jgi:hypothetical protein
MSNNRVYPRKLFEKELKQLQFQLKKAEYKLANKPLSVVSLGSQLYGKFGATDSELIEGYEFFAAHGVDYHIRASALQSIIHLKNEEMKKHF